MILRIHHHQQIIIDESKNNCFGKFVGLRPSSESLKKLKHFQEFLKIKEPCNDLHVTFIYDEENKIDKYKNRNKIIPYICKCKGFKLFGPENNCLVIELDCPNLEYDWKLMKDKYQFHFKYEKYSPHITLSYNFTDSLENLPHPDILGKIILDKEYTEKIISNYGENK